MDGRAGENDAFRLRQGDWRAVNVVRVLRIGQGQGVSMMAYRPISETADSVTLRRSDFEALLGELENARDIAAIPASYLCEIEAGRKPGSFDAMAKLAAALGVDMEDLQPWPQD